MELQQPKAMYGKNLMGFATTFFRIGTISRLSRQKSMQQQSNHVTKSGSTEHQQSIHRPSTELQQSVNDF